MNYQLKSEKYKGYLINFNKISNNVMATTSHKYVGIVNIIGKTKEEAFEKIKKKMNMWLPLNEIRESYEESLLKDLDKKIKPLKNNKRLILIRRIPFYNRNARADVTKKMMTEYEYNEEVKYWAHIKGYEIDGDDDFESGRLTYYYG